MAASFDVKLLEELGSLLGEECQAEHVGMLLGLGVNMKRSPLCGRNFEYFSEDPYLAGKLAVSYIKGLQEKGIAACVKQSYQRQTYPVCAGVSEGMDSILRKGFLP